MKARILFNAFIFILITLVSNIERSEGAVDKPWKNLTADEVFSGLPERSLAIAAEKGDADKIRKLISSGLNVNARGLHGLTPLDLAIFNESKKGVLTLLEAGANPNLYSDDGSAPIHSACYLTKDVYFLKQMLVHGGDANLVRILDKGASDKIGVFPLHDVMRANNNALEKVKILMDHGADLNKSGGYGFLPIESAVNSRQYDVILWLLENEDRFHTLTRHGKILAESIKLDLNMRASVFFERKEIADREKVIEVLKKHGLWN